MPVVIGGFVSVAGLVVRGLFCGVVQKRFHPMSHRQIVMGRRSRLTAFLLTFMLLGRVKIMPDSVYAEW
jgi:branched-subunit amino acid ABC-type transport system permease component